MATEGEWLFAFKTWRLVPALRRGELVRLLGEELRAAKEDLGRSFRSRRARSRRRGSARSRNDLHLRFRRRSVAPALRADHCHRRPCHRMMETWHPLGVAGVISAFNFPVAISPTSVSAPRKPK
ncbi:aldehyde dehydrogenase family protein [Mesorhizobium sp.]|uniref:aldehyde dehydrogenase family protein n=1 Tax=Mesorhizobium sp. TaxID=1871066 RepID=UPI000FE647B5|nr:MAG: aldehyde dehydrogenase family protein [Mesorhizobium sp.]